MKPTEARPKQLIKKKILTVSKYDFCGRVEDVIAEINRWKEQHGSDLVVDWDTDYDGEVEFMLFKEREETDEEYAQRIRLEDIRRGHQEDREKAEYERLKAKFG